MVIATGGRQDLIVALFSISLMISDPEHFPLCLLAICMSSLELTDIQMKALKI